MVDCHNTTDALLGRELVELGKSGGLGLQAHELQPFAVFGGGRDLTRRHPETLLSSMLASREIRSLGAQLTLGKAVIFWFPFEKKSCCV